MPSEFNPAMLWAVIALVGLGFLGLVGWVAVRLVTRIDELTKLLHSDIRDILHSYDKRITALENWRERMESAK